ncbi:MAG: hypothetical protein SFY92_10025, partial [Verrucomicrobiae bacterium]|nr:hypothetical protein [Verrucomicrobiae bacterium]
WNMVYARVQSWFAGTRFGAELHVPLDLSKRLVFKNDPPMPLAVPMVLNNEVVATMAGAPTQGELNAQKLQAMESPGGTNCQSAAVQGEPGVDVPLDEVEPTPVAANTVTPVAEGKKNF